MAVWIGDFDRVSDIDPFDPGTTLGTPRALTTATINGRYFVYVAAAGVGGAIQVLEMSPFGDLTPVGVIDGAPGLIRVTDLTVTGVGSDLFLIASSNFSGAISSFRIDAAGAGEGLLTHVDTVTDADLTGTNTHATFRTGSKTFVAATGNNTGSLIVYRLQDDGTLTQVDMKTDSDPGLPLTGLRDVETALDGRKNLIVTASSEGVGLWSTDKQGRLALLDTANAGGHADMLCATAAVIAGTVHVFAVAQSQGIGTFTVENGALVEQQFLADTDTAHTVSTSRMQVLDIDGAAFLLVHEMAGLALYAISANGTLTRARSANDSSEPGMSIANPANSGLFVIDGRYYTVTASTIWDTVTVQLIGAERDIEFGTNQADLMVGVSGNDGFAGRGGKDTLYGGQGNDDFEGGNGADVIYGGADDDFMMGGSDPDDGADGGDRLYGGSGDDVIIGGNDILNATAVDGRDGLYGGSGNDSLYAGANMPNDPLDDPLSFETLEGGAGADSIHGGIGFDVAIYVNSKAGVTIDLQTGLGSGGEAQGDTVIDIEHLQGSKHADVLLGNAKKNLFLGSNGADLLQGRGGDDTLSAGQDDSDDTLEGGIGNDRLEDDAGGTNQMYGGDGKDTLFGGRGTDFLIGGQGADLLAGKQGDDVYTGGTGNDEFRFFANALNGKDTVTDFTIGADKLNMAFSTTLTDFALVMAATVQDGSAAVITLSAGNTIRLQGIDRDDLTASDFLFAT